MAKDSMTARLHLPQPEARRAVHDAIVNDRVKWNVKEETDNYFKVKQRRTIIWAPVRIEIGFRKESPTTTIVVMNGVIRGFMGDGPITRLRDHMAKLADDVEASASRYVRQ